MAVWLVGWTFAGLTAARALYLLVRSSSHESVTLGVRELFHEPGFLLPQNGSGTARSVVVGPTQFWPDLPRPRIISREQVADGLRLDRVGERQRLSVDCGADRVEIGFALREPEREWLHGVLLAWLGPPDERVFSRQETFFEGQGNRDGQRQR